MLLPVSCNDKEKYFVNRARLPLCGFYSLTHSLGNNSLIHSNDGHTLTCPLKRIRLLNIIRNFIFIYLVPEWVKLQFMSSNIFQYVIPFFGRYCRVCPSFELSRSRKEAAWLCLSTKAHVTMNIQVAFIGLCNTLPLSLSLSTALADYWPRERNSEKDHPTTTE